MAGAGSEFELKFLPDYSILVSYFLANYKIKMMIMRTHKWFCIKHSKRQMSIQISISIYRYNVYLHTITVYSSLQLNYLFFTGKETRHKV